MKEIKVHLRIQNMLYMKITVSSLVFTYTTHNRNLALAPAIEYIQDPAPMMHGYCISENSIYC